MSKAGNIIGLIECGEVTDRGDVRSDETIKPGNFRAVTCLTCGFVVPVGNFDTVFCPKCGNKVLEENLSKLHKLVRINESFGNNGDTIAYVEIPNEKEETVYVKVDNSVVIFKADLDKIHLEEIEISDLFNVAHDAVKIGADSMAIDFAPAIYECGDETYLGYKTFALVTENLDEEDLEDDFILVGEDRFIVSYNSELYECSDVGLFHHLFEEVGSLEGLDCLDDLDEARKADIIKRMGKATYKKVQALKKKAGKLYKVKVDKSGKIEKVRKTAAEIRTGKKAGKHLKKGKVARKRSAKIGKRLLKRIHL